MRNLNVGITYDLRSDHPELDAEDVAEFDSQETIDHLANAITTLGHTINFIGNAKQLLARLAIGERWDIVFNIAEGTHGRNREAQVPSLLELYGIPHVFSDPLTCSITLDKSIAKRLVSSHGLNTPKFALISSVKELDDAMLTYPMFIKPNAEGTSKGIDAKSKVDNFKQLCDVGASLLKRFDQLMLEEYLPGREFTVGILASGKDAWVLGTLEIVIKPSAKTYDYTYETKEKCESLVKYLPVLGEIKTEVERLALAAYRACGCRDAGRVDIRMDASGKPSFMEINALPGLHPTHSDLPMIATAFGMPYVNLIGTILESAWSRVPDRGY